MPLNVGEEAGRLDLIIEQGTLFNVQLQYLEADEETPINLSDFDGRMDIRPFQESPDSDIILTLTTSGGEIVIDGPNGIINLILTADVTTTLSFDCAVYDLELVDRLEPTEEVIRLVQGEVVLSTETTRTTGV